MLAEYLSFILTFIVSAGMAVLGILIVFQQYHQQKSPALLSLLYQQIFLISFFTYGIWGNIILREILSDIELSTVLESKLSIFLPVLGLPFLLVSWFMLIRFVYLINGIKITTSFSFLFFSLFIVSTVLFTVFIQKGIIKININADLFIIRVFVLTNLLVHIFVFIPFMKSETSQKDASVVEFGKKKFLVYFAGVLTYSLVAFYFDVAGYFSACLTIILLFGVSIYLPVIFRLSKTFKSVQTVNIIDFESFCRFYEISKREAEIIREICSGKSNKEIAETLFISLQTVKDHTHRIYFKTEVNSRIQLSNLVREKTGKTGIQS
jgi:DNA-binding CsgD family transcriptional regulator